MPYNKFDSTLGERIDIQPDMRKFVPSTASILKSTISHIWCRSAYYYKFEHTFTPMCWLTKCRFHICIQHNHYGGMRYNNDAQSTRKYINRLLNLMQLYQSTRWQIETFIRDNLIADKSIFIRSIDINGQLKYTRSDKITPTNHPCSSQTLVEQPRFYVCWTQYCRAKT